MKEYEDPFFRVGQKVMFDKKIYIITEMQGQYDPGSVCWTYYLEGVGYVPEYALEAIE